MTLDSFYNVLDICTATILNLVQVSLYSLHKSDFSEGALQIYDSYNIDHIIYSALLFLKYDLSRRTTEILSCFNKKNGSNNYFVQSKTVL